MCLARCPKGAIRRLPKVKPRTHSWALAALLCVTTSASAFAQRDYCSFTLAKLKYGGGGDWYANPSSLKNLANYLRTETRAEVCPEPAVVEAGSPQLHQYPFLYMTGHGNVVFSPAEAENLRRYLQAGGFWLMDDNYGLQRYIRRELQKHFSDFVLQELPSDHPVYRGPYSFPDGLPKIHEHDGKPAQAFGLFWQGRLCGVLTYECDLSDGWEDESVHHDPEPVRRAALQMGANLVLYALSR